MEKESIKEFGYTIKDEVGIHAGPAGLLVKEAKKYESKVVITKDGKSAEATKLRSCRKISDTDCAGYFFEDACQKT